MFAKKDLCMALRFAGRQWHRFFHAIEIILVVAHAVVHRRKNSQTCHQKTEVTHEVFWKISTSSCHEVPNELSNATCSTQTVQQNTNVPAEVCKVPIKRTSGLIVALLC